MYWDFTAEFDDPDAARAAWIETLTQDHERRIRARVTNPGHKTIGWFDGDEILDGQLTIDVDQRDCTRVANLKLYDPTQSIGMEPDSPSSLPIPLRRMVQVFYDIRVPGYGWMGPSVICGPVAPGGFDRQGAEVDLVIHGKERLALGSFGRTHSWKKKTRKITVIREILLFAGEDPSRIHLPPLKNTLHKPFNVSRTDRPLVKARGLARDLGFHLWPDGRGHWRMRRLHANNPIEPFIDSDWLMGSVGEDRPSLNIINGWIVKGDNPKGPKPQIASPLIGLDEDHPFSAQSLARNGEPYWLIEEISRPGVKTRKRATQIAKKRRDGHIGAAVEAAVECLPLPNVEEWDLLRAVDPLTGGRNVRLKRATIPFVTGNMSINAVRQVSRGGGGRGFDPPMQGGL